MRMTKAQGRINWVLLIVLVFALGLLVGMAFGLRHWNRAGRASAGLRLGNEAFAAENWNEAALQFGRYLGVEQNNVEILIKYAKAHLNCTPPKREHISQAINALNIALRQDADKVPENFRREAANLLVDIYLQVGMAGEAEVKAAEQFKLIEEQFKITDRDLQRKMALACVRQRKFPLAVETLKLLIQQDAGDIPAYALLAQIAEQPPAEIRDLPPADKLLDEMISKNPASAQAYAVRAKYWLSDIGKEPDKAKALADLDKAQSCDLTKPEYRLMLVEVWMEVGELAKAREHLQALIATESKNPMLWKAWAELALRGGDDAEMNMVAEKASASLPSNAFLSYASELYIRSGKLDKAQSGIDELRKQEMAVAQADYLQGLLAEKKQQWSAAIRSWQKAVAQGIQTENIYLKLAAAYEHLGDKTSAVRQLRNLVRENQRSFLGQLNLARLCIDLERTDEADEAVKAALRLNKSSVEARRIQTQVRIQMMSKGLIPNDPKTWEAFAQELDALDKTGTGGLNGRLLRVEAAISQGQWDSASKILEGLKKDYPDEIRVAMESCSLLYAQNQFDAVISELRKIVQKFPQNPGVVRQLGNLLYIQKRPDEAIAVLTDAFDKLTSAVDKRDLVLLLVSIYQETGQLQKANEWIQKLAAEQPDDILLKRKQVSVFLAQNMSEQAQGVVDAIKSLEGENGWQWRFEQSIVWFYDKNFLAHFPNVVSLLKENLTANPDDQASRMLLGRSYYKSGELQLAIATFREALSREPDNVDAISAAVSALFDARQNDQAEALLNQALQRQKENLDPRLSYMKLVGLLRQDNLSSAADQLKEMLKQNPDSQDDRLILARVMIRQKKYGEAETLLTELRKARPESPAAASTLIDLRMIQNRPDDAVVIASQFVDAVKTPDAYILRGQLFYRIKRLEEAKADMLKAVELTPDKTQGWLYQVDFYVAINDLPQAIKAVKEAMALSPDNLEVIRRAVVLFQSGSDPADARSGLELLDQSLTRFPKDAPLVLMKARLLLASGTKTSFNQAVDMLKVLTREQPQVEEGWTLLSQAYLSRGDTANASETTLRGLSNLPQSFALMMAKAACEGNRNKSLAIPSYQLICQKFPDSAEAALSLVSAYLQSNDARSALELLGKWKEKPQYADQPRFELALAEATWLSGDTVAAQKLFDALYVQRPDDPAVLITHAGVIVRGQKWTELVSLMTQWFSRHPDRSDVIVTFLENRVDKESSAANEAVESILRKMIEIKPDCVDAMAALGMVLQSSGHSSEALPLYEKAIQLDPARVILLNNIAWILSEDLKQYDRALQFADQAIQKRPTYIDAYDTRGVIYFRLNQLDKSLADLTRCIDEYQVGTPSLIGSYKNLGRTLIALRRNLEGMQALRKALDLNSQSQTPVLSQADLDEINRLMEEASK